MSSVFESVPEQSREWIIGGGLVLAALAAALILHTIAYFVAERITRRTPGNADTSAVRRTRAAARITAIVIAAYLAVPLLPLDDEGTAATRHMTGVALIAAFTWLVIRTISVVDDVIVSRYPVDVRDNLLARRVHTQTRVLTRTAMIVVAVIGFSTVLMTFSAIRQFGTSLLASAGIAGLVVGFAARPALSNLIAGIQLALTQPINIDDVVIVEGEWGRIEEITTTYVVVKIWDDRRLIVPLQYFIEHPFQNWTRRTADLLGSVFVHADYTVPVEAVRRRLREIVDGAEAWDGRVCVLQVTDATDRTVQLRALVSASDSSKGWELRCLVREKLIEFLQQEHFECLPRARAEIAMKEARPVAAGGA